MPGENYRSQHRQIAYFQQFPQIKFTVVNGGEEQNEVNQVFPGGSEVPVNVDGPTSVGQVTLQKPWDSVKDIPLQVWSANWSKGVKVPLTLTVQPVNAAGIPDGGQVQFMECSRVSFKTPDINRGASEGDAGARGPTHAEDRMSLFGTQKTKTVELTRGYLDADGNAHREVTLRVPMIEDEVCRDAAIADMRRSNVESERAKADSEALQTLALVKECIVAWDGIADVQLAHLRQLTRRDAATLINAFYALEAEDAADAKKILKEGPEGNDESE